MLISLDTKITSEHFKNKYKHIEFKIKIFEIKEDNDALFYNNNPMLSLIIRENNLLVKYYDEEIKKLDEIIVEYDKILDNITVERDYSLSIDFQALDDRSKFLLIQYYAKETYQNGYDVAYREYPVLYLKMNNISHVLYGDNNSTHSNILNDFIEKTNQSLIFEYHYHRDSESMEQEDNIQAYAFGHVMEKCYDNIVYWELDTINVDKDFIESLKKENREHYFIYEDEVLYDINTVQRFLKDKKIKDI